MKKLMLFLLVGLFMVSFASAVNERVEWYTGPDNNGRGTINAGWTGQTFTIGTMGENTTFNINIASFYTTDVTTPKVTIKIVDIDGSQHPTDLDNPYSIGQFNSAMSGGWNNVTLTTNKPVKPGTEYAVILNATDNTVNWRHRETTANYSGGTGVYSDDSGSSWVTWPRDQLFEVWGNNSVDIDFNEPTPTNNEQVISGINIINVTMNGNGYALANASLWINGTLNQTIAMTDIINTSLFVKNFSKGAWSFYINSCLGTGECVNSSERILNAQSWAEYQTYYPTPTLVGNIENFGVHLNLSTGLSITKANFMYNGVGYSTTTSGLTGNNFNVTRSLTIPSTAGAIQVYFNATLSNSETINVTAGTTTVSSLAIDDCSAYGFPLYNFTVFDEQTQEHLATANATLNLQIYDSSNSISVVNYSKDFGEAESFRVCLENELTASSDYNIDLEMQYYNSSGGYAKEFYTINNDDLTSADHGTNISLYDLVNTSSQVFKVVYRDSSFLPVKDAIIQVQRKYIEEGLFKTVEQPKTDANGETLVHLEVDEVIYTFITIVNGHVDSVFNDVTAVCQNPSLNDCVIKLTNIEGFTNILDFREVGDFAYTGPTFNRTSREISTTFSILSGTSANVVLNVTLLDGLGNTQICSQSVTSSTGTLGCSIPISFGNSTVIATITKDGTKVAELIVSLARDPADLYGTNIVIIGLIMFVTILGIGISGNPMVTGVFLILGSIALIGFNIIYSTSFIGGAGAIILWFIVAVIIVLIKGANRT